MHRSLTDRASLKVGERDRSIFKVDQELAFEDEKEFVVIVVHVPMVFAFDDAEPHNTVVDFCKGLVVPPLIAIIGQLLHVNRFEMLVFYIEMRVVWKCFHSWVSQRNVNTILKNRIITKNRIFLTSRFEWTSIRSKFELHDQMIQLSTGQHFGKNKTTLTLKDALIVEAGYFPNIEVPWHYHENAYFYFHLNGHLEEVNKKKNYPCVPGTALFHFWQEPHYNGKFSRDAAYYHIEFTKNWFDKYEVDINKLEGDFQLTNPVYQNIFRRIYAESKLNDVSSQLSIDSLCLQAFAEMMRYSAHRSAGEPRWVRKVREILNDCSTEHVSLSSVASETNVHPVHLSREFPKYFSVGFGTYIRKARLARATSMLQSTKQSVTEIAYQCGFSDESHFIRCFKAEHGTTPLQFRKAGKV